MRGLLRRERGHQLVITGWENCSENWKNCNTTSLKLSTSYFMLEAAI